jgi:hypothetical protein
MLVCVLVRCTLPVHVQVDGGFPHRLSEVHAFLQQSKVGPTHSSITGHAVYRLLYTQARDALLTLVQRFSCCVQ